MQCAADRLVQEYLLQPLAEHGQVGVVRNVFRRRPNDTIAHLLGRVPRLSVTDNCLADLDKVHFGLEFNELDDWLALILVL